MSRERNKEEVTYEIQEHVGIIAKYSNGWTKEINKVSWNGNEAKFDIRDWDEKHEHMSRGITLREGEMETLHSLMCAWFGTESGLQS